MRCLQTGVYNRARTDVPRDPLFWKRSSEEGWTKNARRYVTEIVMRDAVCVGSQRKKQAMAISNLCPRLCSGALA